MTLPAPKNIVVVENDPLTLEFLHDMLELWGYTPHAFAEPSTAIDRIRSGELRPDLLVVDLHLDEHGTGDEVIRQVRAMPSLQQVPAFVATGDLAFQGQGLEPIQVLTKPIRPERFKDALAALFAVR